MNWSALILWVAVLPFVALVVVALNGLRPSERALRRRLGKLSSSTAPLGLSMSAGEPGALAAVDDDLVARLCSLAVASSMAPAPTARRWRRRVGAVIGAAGVFGWAGAVAAGASVGLVSTGNLPAPVQRVVADVLEVVNVEVPRPEPAPEPEPAPMIDAPDGGSDDTPTEGGDPADPAVTDGVTPDETNSPAAPVEDPGDGIVDGETTIGDVPTGTTLQPPSGAVGPQPGDTPNVTAPGRSDDTTGNAGESGDSPSVTAPGRSETTPGITAPGTSGTTPSVTAPGLSQDTPSATAPGRSQDTPRATAPDASGSTPGVTAPGRSQDTPSATAPGLSQDTPSATAPGLSQDTPSATAPGLSQDNPSATAPGRSEDDPSATAPGQNRSTTSTSTTTTTIPSLLGDWYLPSTTTTTSTTTTERPGNRPPNPGENGNGRGDRRNASSATEAAD